MVTDRLGRRRQRQGGLFAIKAERSRAKARGQHMGRPPKLTPQEQTEARKRRAEGATLKELARTNEMALI